MIETLPIQRITETATIPTRSHPGDAGLDVYADGEHGIPSGRGASIRTGIAIAIPYGYVGLLWPRSGLASGAGIDTLAGVVDHGYTGEVIVTLAAHSPWAYHVKHGERIAQLLVQPVELPEPVEVTTLDVDGGRGVKGHGSTGC